MYQSYSLDPNMARQADEKSGRIEETGAFTGRIKYAIATKSPGGAEGIELHFESSDRRDARVTVWTYKKDGGVNDSGMRLINAIMTCVMTKQLTPTEGNADVYDFATSSRVSKRVTLFPELQKPVGIVFQLAPEEYKKNGEIKVANRLEIYAAYNSQTGMTASEILTKATAAEKLQHMLSTVKDKPLKKYKPKAGDSGSGAAASHADEFEDDILF